MSASGDAHSHDANPHEHAAPARSSSHAEHTHAHSHDDATRDHSPERSSVPPEGKHASAQEMEHHHHQEEHGRATHDHSPERSSVPPEREHASAQDMEHHHHREQDEHDHEHGHGLWANLQHLLKPHSHDAADSLDDTLVSSQEGIRAVQISLIGLAITAALQLAVAMASGSVAVLADTIHNFADASTAIPLWLAFKVSSKPANARYTYGYGRAEDLAGVFVLLMIVGSAAVALWESVQKLINPAPIQYLGWVALAGLAGFVGNELVAQYRIRVGQKIGSAALVADGYHARTDGLTSLSVLLGAAGVWLGFPIADPLIGLAITVAIVLVLKDSAVQMWRRLMDAVEPELVQQAASAAASAEGVQSVSAVRARWIGHTIHAEALIVADPELSLGDAHRVAERARHEMLHAVPRLSSVTVHVDPADVDGLDHHAEVAHHDHR